MANIRLIKGRIKSARNIAQITKAMELVAASKMKKAQLTALAGKMYADRIYDMVMRLSQKVDYVHHPLLTKPKNVTGNRLVVLLSTNKGLCGALNTNLFRFLHHTYSESSQEFVTVGTKGADFVTKLGKPIIADFSETQPFINIAPALTALVTEKFLSGQYDKVDIVFSEFLSTISQRPVTKTLLPLSIESVPVVKPAELDFLIEPDVKSVFESLLPHYLENQIMDAILQAEASEHSARMIAMRNATDNAMSLTEELTLVYNKARQEKITSEITDMITARMASGG